jgi:hypothetical protein
VKEIVMTLLVKGIFFISSINKLDSDDIHATLTHSHGGSRAFIFRSFEKPKTGSVKLSGTKSGSCVVCCFCCCKPLLDEGTLSELGDLLGRVNLTALNRSDPQTARRFASNLSVGSRKTLR